MEPHDQNARYSLQGILRHHGNTAQDGHYTADVRLSNMDDGKKQWYSFNDASVREGKLGNTERQRHETAYFGLCTRSRINVVIVTKMILV